MHQTSMSKRQDPKYPMDTMDNARLERYETIIHTSWNIPISGRARQDTVLLHGPCVYALTVVTNATNL